MPYKVPQQQQRSDTERMVRTRIAADRCARQRRVETALAETASEALTNYRREKERAAAQGKPTLSSVDEYRNRVGVPT